MCWRLVQGLALALQALRYRPLRNGDAGDQPALNVPHAGVDVEDLFEACASGRARAIGESQDRVGLEDAADPDGRGAVAEILHLHVCPGRRGV